MGGSSEFDFRNKVYDYKDLIIESGGILKKEELEKSEAEEEIIAVDKLDEDNLPIPPDEGKRIYYKIQVYKSK